MSSERIMLALGEDIVFAINQLTYNEFKRSTAYRWVAQQRVNQRPALQYTGLGDDTVSLPGVIYPEKSSDLSAVSSMRDMAEKAEPFRLADSYGEMHGFWVIESVTETRSYLMSDGTPRKIEFELKLKRYS